MGANVQPDGHAELEFIQALERVLEVMLERAMLPESQKLLRKLYDHCKFGGKCDYVAVQSKYLYEIKQELTKRGIPHGDLPLTTDGYVMILHRDIDSDIANEIIQSVYRKDPAHHAQITVETLLDDSIRSKEVNIMELKFDTREDFEAFTNKAYERGSGYTTAAEEVNGKFVVYAQTDNACNMRGREDIPSTIMHMEFDKLGPIAKIKDLQLKHDAALKDEIIRRIKAGQEFVIGNAYNNRSAYVEVMNNEIRRYEWNQAAGQFALMSSTEIPMDLHEPKVIDSLKASLALDFKKVHNAKLMSFTEHEQHKMLSYGQLHETKEKDAVAFVKGIYLDKHSLNKNNILAKFPVAPHLSNMDEKSLTAAQKTIIKNREGNIQKLENSILQQNLKPRVEDLRRRVINKKNVLNNQVVALDAEKETLEKLKAELETAPEELKETLRYKINEKTKMIETVEAHIPSMEHEYTLLTTELSSLSDKYDGYMKAIEAGREYITEVESMPELFKMDKTLKEYQQKAEHSLYDAAHKKILEMPGNSTMSISRKEMLLEGQYVEILKNVGTPELLKYKEALEARGCGEQYEEMVNMISHEFEHNVNVRSIKDVVAEREERNRPITLDRYKEEDEQERSFD